MIAFNFTNCIVHQLFSLLPGLESYFYSKFQSFCIRSSDDEMLIKMEREFLDDWKVCGLLCVVKMKSPE